MTARECVVCGLPSDDHHDFLAPVPAGCMCDPRTWGQGEISNPICGEFKSDARHNEYCATCEHDRACHKAERGEGER